MKQYYLILFFCLAGVASVSGQPMNDDCATAIALPDTVSYCSGPGAFTNAGATVSFPGEQQTNYPTCIDERDEIRDVWFRFVARETAVNIRVLGDITGGSRGTLEAPQFALLDSCTDTVGLGCRSPFIAGGQTQNGGTLTVGDLEVGQTYFILVGARSGNAGTFELCLEQFQPPAEPSSDCATGVVLCDKSTFAVDFLSGTGDVRDNLLSNDLSNCNNPSEMNSSWYRWTCDESGTLGFSITPLGAAVNEDIDFVVYEFANGLDDCGGRQVLRQMYSGETGGQGIDNLPCLGATGLRAGANDIVEVCGCDVGRDDNFLSQIDMVSGRSYGIVIMNFSGSGDGFSIEFDGTGTFLGPEPEFTLSSSEVCVGEALVFEDNSTSVDMIVSREWDFGPTATPRTASGPGPHSVIFGEAGQPGVELVITTSRECTEVIAKAEVNVICCEDQFSGSATITDETCPGDSTGVITFTGTSSFSPGTVEFRWSTGDSTNIVSGPTIAGLGQGDYTVTITDESGCERAFTYTVGGPPLFVLDTLITMPDCAGGTNGALTFTVLSGGSGDYRYSFNGSPFSTDNTLTDLPVTQIDVVVRDAAGCLIEQTIAVNELELGLQPGETVFVEPVCNGDENARIDIAIANGRRAFQYDFGLGGGFQQDSFLTGLGAGSYAVTARDADGCLGLFAVDISDPPVLELTLDGFNDGCAGTDQGRIETTTAGGRPDYAYLWQDGPTDTLRDNLPPGLYQLTVTDDNGCTTVENIQLIEPNPIEITINEIVDNICFGDSLGSIAVGVSGGTPGYLYSIDGENFRVDTVVNNLFSGDYFLRVMDENGCRDSIAAFVDEPEEFIVFTGDQTTVFLGGDTTVNVFSNYFPVQYSWSPDSLPCLLPDCSRVLVGPFETTRYLVTGTNAAGCIDTAGLEVLVVEDLPLYVPNAFSPNGDGVNDFFTLFGGRSLEAIEKPAHLRSLGRIGLRTRRGFPPEPAQSGLERGGGREAGQPRRLRLYRDGSLSERAASAGAG